MVIAWLITAIAVTITVACVVIAGARLRAVRTQLAETEAEVVLAQDEQRRTLELETQLAQALDAMELGVVVVGLDGAAVYRNRAADAFVAARHGNALVEAALREVLESARNGVVGEREVELVGPPLRAFLIRASPLLADGEVARHGAVAMVEESTERRRVDQVRRDFVANISHELRTPIGAIGLLAETIRDEADLEVLKKLSDRMISEADRVTGTIEDLLELSRIEFAEGMAIDAVPLSDIVDAAVARMAAAAEQRQVGLAVRVAGDPVIRGDRRQLVSAVFNLIDNAVKFSRPGTEVIVEVAEQSSTAGSGTAQLSVIDHGIGIPARDVDRVFERFYRVDRARSRDTGGTGLGLAIVRHVVSNHGGDIWVSSREGEGSTFSISLPLEPSSLGSSTSNREQRDQRDAAPDSAARDREVSGT
ncbi:MAG TPA: ATP-binding protein [Microthrixaceae bacterium]|nr:ATP-binding protein [Microthrixaceae bacterium]